MVVLLDARAVEAAEGVSLEEEVLRCQRELESLERYSDEVSEALYRVRIVARERGELVCGDWGKEVGALSDEGLGVLCRTLRCYPGMDGRVGEVEAEMVRRGVSL